MKEQTFEFDAPGYHPLRIAVNDSYVQIQCRNNGGDVWVPFVALQPRCLKYGIRALLARDTEREKIFADAMDLALALADVLGSDVSKDQLDGIAARWQVTSGDATGAEGQGR